MAISRVGHRDQSGEREIELGCLVLNILDVGEGNSRRAFPGVVEDKLIASHEHLVIVEVLGTTRVVSLHEILEFFSSAAVIQRANWNSGCSKLISRPYSSDSRTFSTSSCNEPTPPTSAGAPSSGRKTCTPPSSAICCKAFFIFLAFIGSPIFTRRRISGAKFGTPR